MVNRITFFNIAVFWPLGAPLEMPFHASSDSPLLPIPFRGLFMTDFFYPAADIYRVQTDLMSTFAKTVWGVPSSGEVSRGHSCPLC